MVLDAERVLREHGRDLVNRTQTCTDAWCGVEQAACLSEWFALAKSRYGLMVPKKMQN